MLVGKPGWRLQGGRGGEGGSRGKWASRVDPAYVLDRRDTPGDQWQKGGKVGSRQLGSGLFERGENRVLSLTLGWLKVGEGPEGTNLGCDCRRQERWAEMLPQAPIDLSLRCPAISRHCKFDGVTSQVPHAPLRHRYLGLPAGADQSRDAVLPHVTPFRPEYVDAGKR